MAASNNGNGSTAAWVIGIILVLALVGSLFKNDNPSSSNSGTSTPRYESTEDKLRRVYDSQGIKYDDRMIREDARAIEQLHREFGK
mgnify:CR=1 FL=1